MAIRVYEIIVADAGDAEYETLYGDEFRFHRDRESAEKSLKKLQESAPQCYWGEEGWEPEYKIIKSFYSEGEISQFIQDGMMDA